jgi:glycosyltransferase involved in cell wall biosynthesis
MYIEKYEGRRKPFYLYLHTALMDKSGWNIPALADRYRFPRERLLFDEKLAVGSGVSEQELAARYGMCDFTILPTRGEGWGLPILEAMACGIPVLTTDYSAHPSFCKPGSLFIDIITRESEPITNIERVIVSVKDLARKIDLIIKDNVLRQRLSRDGLAQAQNYNWPIVLKQWEDLFDSINTTSAQPHILDMTEDALEGKIKW